jgi:predicted CXXCH cytochrome family protein
MKNRALLHGKILLFPVGIVFLFMIYNCQRKEDRITRLTEARYFLNLDDSVEYVGMNACKECHYQIYRSYLGTGMGQSFDTASPRKSAAVIGEDSVIHDPYANLSIKPYWKGDSLMVREFREVNGMVVHERTEYVDYVVGSGQHTNSHIHMSGQYAYQAPFTYYTQEGLFDWPPGFEDGHNERFARKIGLECMTCHNGFPEMVLGSENKYDHIPDGIDCERCHGPGEIHVMLKKKSILVDTSRYIDYSIVNPAKLAKELRTDLCARCHLQGTMVLQPGKSFFDFRPGMPLESVMDIFMPLFEGGKEDYIMASHYERMVQSQCYRASGKGLTCTDCHNPHVSVKETPLKKYNNVCMGCHGEANDCSLARNSRLEHDDNCVSCHMRPGPSRDIPHVITHDHKISRPPTREQLESERVFRGLISVNNPETDNLTKARGYLLEYESYHPDPAYLDSASFYLTRAADKEADVYFNALVNFHHLRRGYTDIIDLVESTAIAVVLDSLLTEKEYSNYDAWTAYRIGQAYENSGNALIAGYFYEKAVALAPFHLEFLVKHGSLLAISGKLREASDVFEFILSEDPQYTSAYVNLGYLYVKQNNPDKAYAFYQTALELDPDYLQALLNLAALEHYRGNASEAMLYVDRALAVDPDNDYALRLKETMIQ